MNICTRTSANVFPYVTGVRLGRNYPKRIITDLDKARANSLASVVEMRKGLGRGFVLPDGNEALPLPDGRFARSITRIDFRQEAEVRAVYICTFNTLRLGHIYVHQKQATVTCVKENQIFTENQSCCR